MLDSSDKSVKVAYPGMAVTVTGWKSLPNAGDEVLQGAEEKVKKAITNRERKVELEATMEDLEAINEQRRLERDRKEAEEGEETSGESVNHHRTEHGPKELRLVVKGDVSGSVEAVVDALQCIGNKEASVKIVSSSVGDITESDVLRAQAAQGKHLSFTLSGVLNLNYSVQGLSWLSRWRLLVQLRFWRSNTPSLWSRRRLSTH